MKVLISIVINFLFIITIKGAAASSIPVETFSQAKAEYERLKAESPDMTDEQLFEVMKTFIVSLETTTAPAENAAPPSDGPPSDAPPAEEA